MVRKLNHEIRAQPKTQIELPQLIQSWVKSERLPEAFVNQREIGVLAGGWKFNL